LSSAAITNSNCAGQQLTVPSLTAIVPVNSQLYRVQQQLFQSPVNCTKLNSYSIILVNKSSEPNSAAIVPVSSQLNQVQQLLFRSTVNGTKLGQQSYVPNSTATVPVNSQGNQVQEQLFRSTVNSYHYKDHLCSEPISVCPTTTSMP
jgi:hypothetical protein